MRYLCAATRSTHILIKKVVRPDLICFHYLGRAWFLLSSWHAIHFRRWKCCSFKKKLITVNKRTRSKPHRLKFFTETKNKNSMCDAYTIWINFIVALKIRRVTTPLRFIFFALRRQGTTPLGCISGCTSNKESFGSFRVYLLLHLRSEESQPL